MDKSHFANSLHRKKEGECEKKSTVRLISWNVNGLRAILKRLSMKNVLELIRSLERCGLPSSSLSSSSSSSSSSENHRFSLSLACFQETKLTVAELIESLVRRSNIIIIIIIIIVNLSPPTNCYHTNLTLYTLKHRLVPLWKLDFSIIYCR